MKSTLNVVFWAFAIIKMRSFEMGIGHISVQLPSVSRLCSVLSPPSEWERAAPCTLGGVTAPPHLPPLLGAHVGAADAAGPQAPRSGVPVQSARWQTGQPGWTAAVADCPGTAEFSVFDCCVASLQLQEAQRKHDLLVEHLHKDQEHKRRLVSPETAFTRAHGRLPDLHNLVWPCWTWNIGSSRESSRSASSSRRRPRTDWGNTGSRRHEPRNTTTTTTSSTVHAWWGCAPKKRRWKLNRRGWNILQQ